MLPAVITLAMIGGCGLCGLVMLLRFAREHARWTRSAKVIRPHQVNDPLLRLWSRMRTFLRYRLGCAVRSAPAPPALPPRSLTLVQTASSLRLLADALPAPALRRATPVDRVQGAWSVPEEDLVEPMRTERLLSRHPFNPFHSRSADMQQAMSLHLLTGTTGRYRVGVLFAWIGLVLQVAIGVLSGIGPYLTPGSTGSACQVLALGALRLLWASVLVSCCPCADLLKNAVLVCVFASEGTSAVLLYIAQWSSDQVSAEAIDSLRIGSFLLGLISVFLPCLLKAYDAIVVQFITRCVRRKFDWATATVALCVCLVTVPKAAARYAGYEMGADATHSATVLSKGGKSANTLVSSARQLRKAKSEQQITKAAALEERSRHSPCGTSPSTRKRKKKAEEEGDTGVDDDGGDGGDID